MKQCRAPSAIAFCWSKVNHRGISAEASHQAFAGSLAEGEPLNPGTAPTRVSSMSSTRLDEWVCPRMKFVASGSSIRIVVSCVAISLRPRWNESEFSNEVLRNEVGSCPPPSARMVGS